MGKSRLAFGLIRFLSLVALLLIGGWARPEKKPNIVIIITDQQNADALSCAGNQWLKTPGMDRIAKEGVLFPNAYVNLPVCLPQRYTWWTGRLPCTRRQADPNNKPTISVGNIAQAGGYKTFYYGKWHVQDKTFASQDTKYHGFQVRKGGKDRTTAGNAAKLFADPPKGAPFLAVFSLYNPHDICEWGRKKSGHKEKISMKNGEVRIDPPLDECPPLPENFEINPDEAEAVGVRREVGGAQAMAMKWDRDTWRQYRWAYYRFVELADQRICEILDAMEKNRLMDNTVVIMTSDHGDGAASHKWHQKSVLYDESVRVPFIVRYPGKGRAGVTDDRLISSGIDMMATVCDIVGQPMPEGPYYGKSALPSVLKKGGSEKGHTYVVSESETKKSGGASYKGRSVRTLRYKYHVWSQGKHREQFFDMEKDPGETKNLAGDAKYAKVLEEHRAHFADWLKRTDDTYSVKRGKSKKK